MTRTVQSYFEQACRLGMVLFGLALVGFGGGVAKGDAPTTAPVVSDWIGYQRETFDVDGRRCFLVEPKKPAEGNPWIWRTEFFGIEPQADLALLERGFHLAYINVQNMYGAPVAMGHMSAFYDVLTREKHLSSKPVLEGLSRGGLFALNWAAGNPQKVACLYLDAPVCDFKSWPGGKGRSKGSAADWQRLLGAYAMTEDEALAYKLNPIDNLAPLAKAQVPILCVCGNADQLVPIEENAGLLERRYQALGGSIMLIAKPFGDHHPHSLANPSPIVSFVVSHTVGAAGEPIKVPGTPFGYDYFVLRDGMENSRLKFSREKTGHVVFLGGSITDMKHGWRDLVCADLQKRFPDTKFDFVNAGIPSMGSTPDAFRFARDVLAGGPVDLLFVDAAVNDDVNGMSETEQIRGMEGIIRHARLANPLTDIVMLHFVDPPMMDVIRGGAAPPVIASHEKVAVHYRVASLNLAQEVTERIAAGEFTWDRDFKNLHPSPFGHGVYARSIARLLDSAWSHAIADDATPQRHTLPPQPLDVDSYFGAELVDIGRASLGDGWTLDPNWHPMDKAGTRPGFVNTPALVADKPGATLHLKFEGTAVGIFVAAGPDAGTVEYSIDGGAMKTQSLYTQWSAHLHIPWAYVLAADCVRGKHDLTLRVGAKGSGTGPATSVRVFHFLVNASDE